MHFAACRDLKTYGMEIFIYFNTLCRKLLLPSLPKAFASNVNSITQEKKVVFMFTT